jgi:hypothetical protein
MIHNFLAKQKAAVVCDLHYCICTFPTLHMHGGPICCLVLTTTSRGHSTNLSCSMLYFLAGHLLAFGCLYDPPTLLLLLASRQDSFGFLTTWSHHNPESCLTLHSCQWLPLSKSQGEQQKCVLITASISLHYIKFCCLL